LNLLLDTNILIDQLRGLPKAIDYGKILPRETSISTISVAELFAGVRSAQERQKIKQLIQTYNILSFDNEAAELAGDYLQKFYRSHSVDIADAAIAATAKLHKLELVTLNIKHFPMFSKLRKPY